jgi:rhizoxin synthesis polyketide synthase/nonribosomal peptide synthetase RhiA
MLLVSPLTLAESGYYGSSWPAAVLHARPYSIRIATGADVDALVHIEGLCWVPALQAERAQLAERVSRGFTYVAIVPAHGVAAVLYTQRIAARDELLAPGASSATHETLHAATGPVVQLLAVAALPQFTHLQLGAALRDLALQVAKHEGAAEVVAMTRCSHLGRRELAGASQAAYAAYVAAAVDPGLAFHTGAGARVVAIVAGYRPADAENLGNAVLVCYSRESEPEPAVLPPAAAVATALSVKPAASATPAASAPKFEGALGAALQRVGASLSISIDLASCLDSSLMDMEFDSFALSELLTLLEREVAPQLAPLPSTLLFDHPTPRAVLAYLDARAASQSGGGGDGLPPAPSLAAAAAAAADAGSAAGASRASLARSLAEAPIALVLTSSRLPGGCNRSDALTSLLRSHGDAIHTGPPGWSGDACGGGEAFGGFLSAPQGAERFGASFFGIAEAEAISMDPHQRLLLELGTEILVGAVLGDSSAPAKSRPKTLGELLRSPSHMASQTRTAVCVGLSNHDWQFELASSAHGARGGAFLGTSVAPSIAANRLSYVLGLGGASLVVDTACSSAGTALHLAARLLREPSRGVDRVVVGALDLLLSPRALAVRKHADDH